MLNENELLHLLKEDDEGAFAVLYKKYWFVLYKVAWKRMKHKDRAKDVVQDVFISLWNRRGELEVEHLEAWLLTATKFQVLKRLSREKISTDIALEDDIHVQDSSSTDERIRTKEYAANLEAIIRNLPHKRREIFLLRYEQSLTTSDIASRLNLTRKTVQNQLIRAMQDIKSSLTLLLFLFWL